TAAAAFITVLTYESPNPVERWTDEISQVTGEPYTGPEQYEWEHRLTPRQHDFMRDLWRARYGPRGPVPSFRLEPAPSPTKQTEPEPQRRRRRRRCDRRKGKCPSWQPRLTRPNTYWNLAYEYRRAENMLGQYDFNQNVAVLLLEDEAPIIEKNAAGLHSEEQIIWKLEKRSLYSDCPILGLFSERKPCPDRCQKHALPRLCSINNGVPFGVFFAIDYYNSSEGMKTDKHRHELIKSYHQAGYKF
ncbi:MAG TPA: hypothetical protein VNO14_19145, partial [Blastocatellia bacterium]|nr:hypothetical protein [Blastocatellia bacterium]